MTTNEETNYEVAEQVLCDGCVAVPLTVLALDYPMPIAGWEPLFEELEVKVVTDFIGRKAVSAAAARRLLNTLRRRDELAGEDRDRMFAKLAAKHPVPVMAGLPMVEGMTPFESMAAAGGGVVTPSQEFSSGRERPNFLADELAESARATKEKQAANAKRKLADQARDKLGGKR